MTLDPPGILSNLGKSKDLAALSIEVQHAVQNLELVAVGQEARQRKLPILIMFSRQGCPYCDVVRDEFLKPMLRSGDYTNRVIMLEIHSDSHAQLRDFNGQMISAEALAHRYQASFAPTVVFLNHQGKELVERLIGITTRDFYGGFLDEAINQSLQRVHSVAVNGTD